MSESVPIWTVPEVLSRLLILENKLEAEGLYASANTIWMARMTISSQQRRETERDLDKECADDGQPTEAQEWHDYDPDC